MKHPLHDIELIERYFDNTLSSAETIELKERLKKDYEFQKLFDQEKVLVSTIRLQAAKKDLAFLKDLEKSFGEQKNPYIRTHWYYYAAAACITLVALFMWNQWGGAEKPEELYAAYFQPHPNIFEPTLRGESAENARAQAFQSYEQGNYERASESFTRLLEGEQDAGMLMLLGNSNLLLDRTELAKQNFMDLIAHFDELDLPAKWYLSLCYLKTGDTASAQKLLAEIAQTETAYAGKANDLLQRLN
jgi:hypothetical protein